MVFHINVFICLTTMVGIISFEGLKKVIKRW